MTSIPKPVKAVRVPTPLRRNQKPLKRSGSIKRGKGPARVRKTPLSKLRTMLWERFRVYDKDRDGRICFTCDAGPLEGSNCHAGHMVSSTRASVRYSPSNVFVQCFRCNHSLRGNVAEYTYRYIKRFGAPVFDRLMLKSRELKTWTAPEVRDLIAAIERGGADYEMFYAETYGI